jgi:hypothetical protein
MQEGTIKKLYIGEAERKSSEGNNLRTTGTDYTFFT